MKLSFRIKHYFFGAFRELFVHHHGSLEFRAKLFALMICANKEIDVKNYIAVKNYALKIYKEDEDRANLLMLSTKELVKKVKDNNGLNIDMLVSHIQKELRIIPRYAKKIDIDALKSIIDLTDDEDTKLYQKNILEFLSKLKDETLHTKKSQIEKSEESLESKY